MQTLKMVQEVAIDDGITFLLRVDPTHAWSYSQPKKSLSILTSAIPTITSDGEADAPPVISVSSDDGEGKQLIDEIDNLNKTVAEEKRKKVTVTPRTPTTSKTTTMPTTKTPRSTTITTPKTATKTTKTVTTPTTKSGALTARASTSSGGGLQTSRSTGSLTARTPSKV